jgi:hypothetical protein
MTTRKKRSPAAIDCQVKCDAPADEFARFAKTLQRAKKSLGALVSSPAADPFVKRLIAEALSGQPHASACLRVIDQLVKDPDWRDKLRAAEPPTEIPAPNQLTPKDVEPVGRLLRDLLPKDVARAWIAFAYLTMKGAPQTRSAVEGLLLDAATTSNALLEALSRGVAAVAAETSPVPKNVIARTITAIERFAKKQPVASDQGTAPGFGGIAARASRAELIRLVAALGSLRDAPLPGTGPRGPDDANGEAAWVLADQAVARALQATAALTHALDLATNVDSKVRDYAQIVTQAVEGVAAKRELELQGVVGETADYDPAVHEDIGIDRHSLVRIRRPVVVQGKPVPSRIVKKAEIAPA